MELTLKIPEPHSKKQALIMNCFHVPDLQELWVACGTKFGKSLSAAGAISSAAIIKKQSLYRWIAPHYSVAKIGMRYCKRILPPDPYVTANNSTNTLTIENRETLLQFLHGTDPEATIEGEGTQGNVLDEMSKMKEQVYTSVWTTTTLTRGPILALSTPRGKGFFYNKCMEAKEEMELARRQGRNPRKAFITAPTSDNPYVLREAIENAKKDLPLRLFEQYYEAKFIDDSSVFVGLDACIRGVELYLDSSFQHWVDEEVESKTVVIGVDWAKTTDYTVFTAFDTNGPISRVIGVCRFQGIDYVSAIKHLYKFAKQFKEVLVIYHDKTGVGVALDDMLSQTTLPFEGIVFTNKSKAKMVSDLILGIQKQKVEFPNWAPLKKEMDAYEVQTNDLGTMKYAAPSGLHDDIVSSLFLGYAAILEFTNIDFSVKIAEDLKSHDLSVEKWYQTLIEENDDF